ncbi:hypothetical protein GVAV_000442 [Gurleya vavrai]
MPIRGIDSYKTIPQVFSKKPSLLLKNEKLAIDGFWFLKKYCFDASFNQISANGFNQKPLINLISFCKKNKTDLLWIWNGIKPRKNISQNFSPDFFKLGIDELEKKNFKYADINFKKTINYEDYVLQVNAILQKNEINYIRAPFYAMAQAAFISQNMNLFFFGPTDFLLFENTEKMIIEFIGIDNEITHIEIINKKLLLKELNLSPEKFQVFGLILGSELCPTIPIFANMFDTKKILEFVQDSRNLFETIKDAIESFYKQTTYLSEIYLKNFIVACTILKYCPVMKDGKVLTFREENVPGDLEIIFGKKICDFLFEKMFFCRISAEVLNNIAFVEIKEKNESGLLIKESYLQILKGFFEFDIKISFNNIEKNLKKINYNEKKLFVNENEKNSLKLSNYAIEKENNSLKLSNNAIERENNINKSFNNAIEKKNNLFRLSNEFLKLNLIYTSDLSFEQQILLSFSLKQENIYIDFISKLFCLNIDKVENKVFEVDKDALIFYNEMKYLLRLLHNFVDVLEMFVEIKFEKILELSIFNSVFMRNYKEKNEITENNFNFLKKARDFYAKNTKNYVSCKDAVAVLDDFLKKNI